MKIRRSLLMTIVLVVATLFIGQGLAQSSSTARRIKELDAERMAAMVAGNLARLEEILSDDLTYTHSSATVDTKAQFIDALRSGRTKYQSIAPSDVVVRVYNDAAVVTGHAAVSLTSGGQDRSFQLRFTDVYVKRRGRWQMVSWQSTRLP